MWIGSGWSKPWQVHLTAEMLFAGDSDKILIPASSKEFLDKSETQTRNPSPETRILKPKSETVSWYKSEAQYTRCPDLSTVVHFPWREHRTCPE